MFSVLRVGLLMLLVMPAWAAIDVYQFETAEQEQRFRELGKELRCPKCQNQSIGDSDAGIAQDMRDRVHRMILEGKSDEEITAFFVSRYGDFVTYRPPVTPVTSVLWVIPLLLLGGGIAVIVLLLRRASKKVDDDEAENGEQTL